MFRIPEPFYSPGADDPNDDPGGAATMTAAVKAAVVRGQAATELDKQALNVSTVAIAATSTAIPLMAPSREYRTTSQFAP